MSKNETGNSGAFSRFRSLPARRGAGLYARPTGVSNGFDDIFLQRPIAHPRPLHGAHRAGMRMACRHPRINILTGQIGLTSRNPAGILRTS